MRAKGIIRKRTLGPQLQYEAIYFAPMICFPVYVHLCHDSSFQLSSLTRVIIGWKLPVHVEHFMVVETIQAEQQTLERHGPAH